jgi:hypothetical protein
MNTSLVSYTAPNKRILFEIPITRITKINQSKPNQRHAEPNQRHAERNQRHAERNAAERSAVEARGGFLKSPQKPF